MSEKFAQEAYVESVERWLVPATVLFIVVSLAAAFGLQFLEEAAQDGCLARDYIYCGDYTTPGYGAHH